MNVNLWKKALKRIVCALPIAALSLSLIMLPGGAAVESGPSPLPDAAGGSGFVYAESVSPTADHMIRVHLSSLGAPTSIKPKINGSYTIADNGAAVSGSAIIAANGSSGIKLTSGESVFALDNDILLQAATRKVTNSLSLGGGNYPGDLRIINKSGKLKIISHVDMETYLLGVVPYEAGDSKSSLEAIKAQAVAARTFAYYVMNSRTRAKQEHDVVNTTASQVYKGYNAKYTYANSAVVATACQILLTSSGDNVFACYSASNGGHTEYPKSSGAAGTNFPYLPYREDPYDLKYALSHNAYNSSVTIPKSLAAKDLKSSKSQPYAMLRDALKSAGADPANLSNDSKVSVKEITLTNPRYSDNKAPRVYTGADFTLGIPKTGAQAARDIKISFGPYIDGNKIKRPFLNAKLGLSDKSKFSMLYLRNDENSFLIASVRYGHSAGMSQIGAFQMSSDGKSYKDILAFYYLMGTETKLVTKEWPVDNGVSGGPVPADAGAKDSAKDAAKDVAKDSPQTGDAAAPAYKVTSYSAKGTVSVKGSLNVRAGPATSYKKLGSLKNKAKVTITGKSGAWYRVKYGGDDGFVTKSYIKITSETKKSKKKSVYPFKAKVKTKSGKLAVRAGAGAKYKKLGSLKKGTKVTIKGAKGSWYKITYKKKTAYVLKKYIKKL